MNKQISKRRFQFCDYNVSHNQLLIRSPKNKEFNTNIDIKFIGVSYLDIPTTMRGFLFSEPSIDEASKIKLNLPGTTLEIFGHEAEKWEKLKEAYNNENPFINLT